MFGTIRNKHGESLDYSYQQADPDSPSEWIYILGHGVTGNKDRPLIVDSAAALNAAGFDTLALSFSGNGNSDGRFQESTISKEIEDLSAVIDAADSRKVAYIGHSMGGAVGVMTASRDNRIQKLVSLAGMVDTRKFALTEFGGETPDGGLMWGQASCPLSSAYMIDATKTIGSTFEHAKTIEVPWLLIHGTEDDTVLIDDSESIAALSKPNIHYKRIEGADHLFNDEARSAATGILVSWATNTA